MENKSLIKRRILLLLSLLIAVLIGIAMLQPFCMPSFEDENRIRRFHNEPENTLDVVIIGSSDVYTGFSSGLAYKEFGIRSYPYAISGETCLMWETMVKDILKTQSPDLILIETYGAGYSESHLKDTAPEVFKLLDTMPLSIDKYREAKRMAEFTEGSDTLSFLIPFIKYHGSYGSYFKNFKNAFYLQKQKTTPLKGIHNKTARFNAEKLLDLSEVHETHKLSKSSRKAVRSFIKYCKTIDTKIVFIKFPTLAKEVGSFMYDKHLRSNKVKEMVEKEGFDFISMQQYAHDIGLDNGDDFYDYGHANIYGQEKITRQICRLLIDNYGVPTGKNTVITEDNDKEWQLAADSYSAYYDLSNREIAEGIEEDLKDDRSTLTRVRKELREKEENGK